MRYFGIAFAIEYHDDMLSVIGGLSGYNNKKQAKGAV